MSDKERILKKIHDEMDGLMDAQGNFEYPEHEGAYHALCNLETYIDSLQEEKVSDDLKEAARESGQKHFPDADNIWARPNYEAKHAELAFKEGANWQKQQMMKDAIDGVCIDDGDAGSVIDTEYGVLYAKPGTFDVFDKLKVIIVKVGEEHE